MRTKSPTSAVNTASKARTAPSRRKPWVDPDDAPEITDDMLKHARIVEVVKDGKVVQRGRPALGDLAKQSVTLRLDPDVIKAYRATGDGWQSRINADLVKTAKRLKA